MNKPLVMVEELPESLKHILYDPTSNWSMRDQMKAEMKHRGYSGLIIENNPDSIFQQRLAQFKKSLPFEVVGAIGKDFWIMEMPHSWVPGFFILSQQFHLLAEEF